MSLKRIIGSVALCGAILTSVGCSKAEPTDNFVEDDFPQPRISEDVVMETEFPEYDGDTEEIFATIKNNGDCDFGYGERFVLQKLDGEEWRYIATYGMFKMIAVSIPPSQEHEKVRFDLQEHVKLPLLPGRYRIGFPTDYEFEQPTPIAEFTVK